MSSEANYLVLNFCKYLQKLTILNSGFLKKNFNYHLSGFILMFLTHWCSDQVAILPFLYS